MKHSIHQVRQVRGFSLVELLVCLAILGFMASLALPVAEMTVQREKERELKRALWEIRDALDAYRVAREQGAILGAPDVSAYPPSLEALTVAVPDARPGKQAQLLRFLRAVPRDPFAAAGVPADKTWALRSFQSEAGNPQPGVDVYDVYSRSNAIGLNGIPLRRW